MKRIKKAPKSLREYFNSGKWAKRAKERKELSLRITRLIEWAKKIDKKLGVKTEF